MYRTTRTIQVWICNGPPKKVPANDWLEYMGRHNETEVVMSWHGQLCLVPINYFTGSMMFMG